MLQAEIPKFLRWSRMCFCEKDNVSSGLCSIGSRQVANYD
jgi:hypothetical protein